MSDLRENEKWWQENGGNWSDIVWERRQKQPLYGIQEVVLSSYFSKLPVSKVLEFGVGFGRHVEYLNDIPNIEVHGVDQSPTMLRSLSTRLNRHQDLVSRMVQIEPRQKLPYPDSFFDVVYTVSVLIHIQPEDLKEILKELIRVSKHRVIHFENNFVSASAVTAVDHSGCWAHPLMAIYQELGYRTELLTKAADLQDVYMVHISDDPAYNFHSSVVMMNRLKQLDQRIRPYVEAVERDIDAARVQIGQVLEENARLREAEQQNQQVQEKYEQIQEQYQQVQQQYQEENKQLEEKLRELTDQLFTKKVECEDLNKKFEELKSENNYFTSFIQEQKNVIEEIQSSIGWKVIIKIRKNRLLYLLSKPFRRVLKKKKIAVEEKFVQNNVQLQRIGKSNIIEEFKGNIEHISSEYVAIYHPDWIGVSNSTKDLFAATAPLREVSDEEALMVAKLLHNKKFQKVIFSGFAQGYNLIAKHLKELDKSIKINIFWHGNTSQMYEDYSWLRHHEIITLFREGILDLWGFAKKSMAESYRKLNFNTAFVMNYVPAQQQRWISNNTSEIRIGLYASGNYWNKNSFTQIAAVGTIDKAVVYATPYNERIQQYANQIRVKLAGHSHIIPREQLYEEMAKNSVNLYVTFSECAPLVPLESLSLGVPCLTGPNHHYFKGTPLEDYLVVNSPDDTEEIAFKVNQAITNRDRILELYLEWIEDYKNIATESLTNFIRM